jgi:ParB-like chromosome segregation protein Spo0J
MSTFQQHPLSAAFPSMQPDEYQALVDSISNIGVQNPITMYDGMVLDGWNRYNAALEAGVHCPSVELGDVDLVDFVKAQNGARRNITPSQTAFAYTKLYAWVPVGKPGKSNSAVTAGLPKTTKELAAIAGVGTRTIEQAKAVHAGGTQAVQDAVKTGAVSVETGAAVARLPARQQNQIAAQGPDAMRAAARPAPADSHADELAEAAHAIIELSEEVETLRIQIAVGQLDAPEVERISAAEIITDLRAQVKALDAEIKAMRVSRDGFQRENRDLMAQLTLNGKELKKLRSA